jgi:hypothetical protein
MWASHEQRRAVEFARRREDGTKALVGATGLVDTLPVGSGVLSLTARDVAHSPRRPSSLPDRSLKMAVSYGFLSTYPPTECGLATFTAALLAELRDGKPPSPVGVVRIVDGLRRDARHEVVHHLVTGSPGGEAEVADILSGLDVAVVQHEYGIYGGPDGDQVLAVLDHLTVPIIVVLHTVLVAPTPHQREVLERVLAAADAVVTMTPTARRRLLNGYAADPDRVALIPHGAPDNRVPDNRRPGGRRPPVDRPIILTWGLLGPGKGI